MGSEGMRPKLAVIVGNQITGDSRVQKTALAAARDGWDVTLVGRTRADRIARSQLGPVKVIRVPVQKRMVRAENLRRQRTPRARLTQAGFPVPALYDVYRAKRESAVLARAERVDALQRSNGPASSARTLAIKAGGRVSDRVHRLRARAYEWEERRHADAEEPVGSWRHDAPGLLDLEIAFVPVLERIKPDVIHANDITMLNTGAVAAARLRAQGHRVAWLYDAHEYVAGVDWPKPRMLSAYPEAERDLIHSADAVVTVSPEIAALLQEEHKLPSLPLVVRNTPVREAIDLSNGPSVRRTAGVDEDTPLLVYSGYTHAQRGLDTAIQALPNLPEFHLAIVSGRSNPELRSLQQLAQRLGVQTRVHVVPYVDPNQVASYLSSADVGLICSQRTINYELSLPTKLAEYLHAGLPVVCSDLQTLTAFVREHEVGQIFDPSATGSFESAITQLYAERDRARKNISEAVLDELSWEHQSAGLLSLYRALSDKSPRASAPDFSWHVQEGPAKSTPGPEQNDRRPGGGELWRELTKHTPVRLGLGPANFAGQLASYAQALCTARADVSAEVIMHVSKASFGYPADVYVKNGALTRLDVQVEQLQRILPRYTHLIADAFRPVFGTLNGNSIAGDLPALRNAGIKVALLAHGTDVRHPLRHMERNPYSLYFDAPEGFAESRVATTERNQRIAASSGLPVFVTTPDLLDDLPAATWVPLVVDVDVWACDRPVMERRRPVVLHAPSKRWTKGTDRFASALEAMAERGLIEFELVEGLPWSAMRERVHNADLVIDQFAVGSYGTFACEAMAAGKPVIAHLTDTVSAVIGAETPILNTTPEDVVSVVESLLDDRDRAARIGEQSRAYVREYHDGRRSAQALIRFLDVH